MPPVRRAECDLLGREGIDARWEVGGLSRAGSRGGGGGSWWVERGRRLGRVGCELLRRVEAC